MSRVVMRGSGSAQLARLCAGVPRAGFGVRAETIFVSSVAPRPGASPLTKSANPGTASPARETPAHRWASCALPSRGPRIRGELFLQRRFTHPRPQILHDLLH
jgi:hypothetical protein